jgi:hypothetical protein
LDLSAAFSADSSCSSWSLCSTSFSISAMFCL